MAENCSFERLAGGAGLCGSECVDPAGVPGPGVRHVDLSLEVPPP